MLLEPQSTNLITYSEDFSSSWHLNGGTITANSGISPDGNNNAYKYNTDGSYRIFRQLITLSTSTDYTFSFYAKNVDATNAFYRVHNNSNATDVISATSYISQINNSEWNRVEVNFTTDSTGTQYAVYLMSGNSGGDILFWGAQTEELPYATSYIPTSGSVATRLKDQAYRSGLQDDVNSDEGVLFADIAALADDLTFRVLSISDETNSNVVKLGYRADSNHIYCEVRSGNVSQAFLKYEVNDITQYNKAAVKFKEDDFALWINGQEVLTDSSGSTNIPFHKVDFKIGTSSSIFYGKVKDLRGYNTALSDAELQKLTT